jgi:pSer/pThr/pTyr-binding forkhead associated (FHA) protein
MNTNTINTNPKMPGNIYLIISSQVFPIKSSITRIGRKLDNDLVIQDTLVSRYHAEIRLEENKFIIVDCDSTGGTFINNKRINKGVLYSGDIILLATVPIMFMNESDMLERVADEETGGLKENKKNNTK